MIILGLKFRNVQPVLKEYIPEKIFPKHIPVTSDELIVLLKYTPFFNSESICGVLQLRSFPEKRSALSESIIKNSTLGFKEYHKNYSVFSF